VRFNPILAMLALSGVQHVVSLQFRGQVDIECGRRILEVIKAVKRQPVELLCLLADIISTINGEYLQRLVLILEFVKHAMAFIDGESVTPLLRSMVSGVQRIQHLAEESHESHSQLRNSSMSERITGEAQRICSILQAKYAVTLISSTTQLRLLSCARSAALAQPAMGWLRMHEPL
jgi:hypothetical protein